MLSPLGKVPRLEVLDGHVSYIESDREKFPSGLTVNVGIYVVPLDNTSITFPFHKCTASIRAGNQIIDDDIAILMESQGAKQKRERTTSRFGVVPEVGAATRVEVKAVSDPIESTRNEIVIRGCGRVEVIGFCEGNISTDYKELQFMLTLSEAVNDYRIPLAANFVFGGTRERETMWTLSKQ
jgi:hypothetical protein